LRRSAVHRCGQKQDRVNFDVSVWRRRAHGGARGSHCLLIRAGRRRASGDAMVVMAWTRRTFHPMRRSRASGSLDRSRVVRLCDAQPLQWEVARSMVTGTEPLHRRFLVSTDLLGSGATRAEPAT
jgi:hypothetical protein